MLLKQNIEKKIRETFKVDELEITDESHLHGGHSGNYKNPDTHKRETHLKILVVSNDFSGMPLVERHRKIEGLLSEERKKGLHALTLRALTSLEVQNKPELLDNFASPACRSKMVKK
jgi:BolA protein